MSTVVSDSILMGDADEPDRSQRAVVEGSDAAGTAVPALRVSKLTGRYDKRPVLWDVELTIQPGTLTAIVGPNGAGKSTLLKAILGIVPKDAGRVLLLGKPYAKVRQRVAYVPQRESVDWDFPINALEVVLMGTYGQLGWFRRPGRKERAWALECLDHVGMADFAKRHINQLSGGQQQRVFFARALAQQADVLLMDEPFAGVDAATEKTIIGGLNKLRDAGKTILVVHHSLQTVRSSFERVVLMNVSVLAEGPVESTLTPANLARTYGGDMAVTDGPWRA